MYSITSSISVGSNITVRSVNGRAATILQGGFPALTNRIFTVSGGFVHGFTITNGCVNNSGGGGVYIDANGGTVSNCTIIGNQVITPASNSGGGGIMMLAGTCADCLIANNYCGNKSGGGAHLFGVNAGMENCVISNNFCIGQGGGVFVKYAQIRTCDIVDNVVDSGGASPYSSGGGIMMTGGGLVSNDPRQFSHKRGDSAPAQLGRRGLPAI